MTVTNAQVQHFVDERVRPHCEAARGLVRFMESDEAVIEDIYNYLNGANDYADTRTDVPHQATGNNVLAFNSFAYDVLAYMKAHGQWPVVQSLCVQP